MSLVELKFSTTKPKTPDEKFDNLFSILRNCTELAVESVQNGNLIINTVETGYNVAFCPREI